MQNFFKNPEFFYSNEIQLHAESYPFKQTISENGIIDMQFSYLNSFQTPSVQLFQLIGDEKWEEIDDTFYTGLEVVQQSIPSYPNLCGFIVHPAFSSTGNLT
jgi:hypothetical protein